MYLEYWGLKKTPFGNVPDSNIFYESPQHEEALFRLLFAVKHRKGVAMLTGDVGCGKTTVSRAFIHRISIENFEVHTLTNPALDSMDLIRAILMNFGEDAEGDSKSILLTRLRNRLGRNAEQGLSTVLMIDEAHVISDRATFEELRMLLNMQLENRFLITLILIGQPPLLEKITALPPLNERIGIKYHLEPLDFVNAIRYLMYRLRSVGAERGIFTKDSVKALYDYSNGIPLRINNICDRSLLVGFMRKASVVNKSIVAEAIEDLK
ncbi:MAG: AAA family ATPase [Desulfobacterales bacterium]|nr:AAA family ATPase [Desulfobacterales bacterium]